MIKGTIALDFDGVIHSYTSPFSKDVTIIPDPPVADAFDYIANLIEAGLHVMVFTTRCREYPGHTGGKDAMIAWFEKYGLERHYIDQLEFTAEKKAAILYVDDHGWQFTGRNFPTLKEIEDFTTWVGKKSSTLPGGHNA